MQNPIQEFRQSSIVFGKPDFCLKFWKFWRASTTTDFHHFYWCFPRVPYLPMSTKGCVRFFLFCLKLELFTKIKKNLVYTHSQKPDLSITQDLKRSLVQNFSKNIKLYGSWSSSKFHIFFSRCEFFVGKNIRQQLISQSSIPGPLFKGGIRLLLSFVSIKMQTYANRSGGWLCQCGTFTHKFRNVVPSP